MIWITFFLALLLTPPASPNLRASEEAMSFSAVQNTISPAQVLKIYSTKGSAKILEVKIEGENAADFFLKGTISGKATRKKPLEIPLQFSPIGIVGVRQATVAVYVKGAAEPFRVPLYGLSAEGVEVSREPTLANILKTLGYAVNNGWETLTNTVASTLQGDELDVSLFQKAGKGTVTMLPVARYSQDFESPFGFYSNENGQPRLRQVGVLQASSSVTNPQHQRLMPELKQAVTTFDPDSTIFGVYASSPSHLAYSEDRWNLQFHPEYVAHATRIYALRDRQGNLVPNSYLVCFEESTNGDYQDYVFVLSNVKPVQIFQPIFNKKTLHGWYTFITDYGLNFDPLRIFGVERDGTLRISGEKFGYIATNEEYENFHLRLQFRWGEKKWPPRQNAKRDSGILYYFPKGEEEKVWPKSVECQIQETDCGDFWLVDYTTISVDGKRNEPGGSVQIVKKRDAEKPYGEWNTVEVIANHGICTHIVNGVVVNRGEDPSVRKGKLVLQSEGAEIFYKDIEVAVYE